MDDENKNINKLFSQVLNVVVEKVSRLSEGTYNKVYKVTTSDKSYVVRIFPKDGTQDINQIKFLETKLAEANVLFPKTLFCSSGDRYFPYGCSISEYIQAYTAKELLNQGVLSLEDYYLNLGKHIKKVHSIHFQKFGSVNQESSKSSGLFSEFKINQLEKKVNSLSTIPDLKIRTEIVKLYDEVRNDLKLIDGKFAPVLTHGDINSNNILIDQDKNYYIIDWDYAMVGVWIEDFSNMTYWSSKITEEIKGKFLEGYGDTGFSFEDILKYEKLFHKVIAISHIKWLYLDEHDIDQCYKVLSKFGL